MKISKNKKMRFFLMSQGSLDPKIRFLGQKVCSVAHVQTDRHTDRHCQRETCTFSLGGLEYPLCDAGSSVFCSSVFLSLRLNAFYLFITFPHAIQPCCCAIYVWLEKRYEV